jgi:protein-tyrosine phosphatase
MEPYTYIQDGVAIGGLLAYGEDLTMFSFKMNVAWEVIDGDECILDRSRYAPVSSTVRGEVVLHARLNDDDYIEPQLPEIKRAVDLVCAAMREGKSVIVTCAVGRNRSGLVLAESLIQLGGDVEEVIANIQTKRQHALGNKTFVSWLRRDRTV